MEKKYPLITVVVPMHNSVEYISRCIDSIIQQTYDNFELILIDDHSSDDSVEICRNYQFDSRIKLILNKGKNGPSPTRNLGIKKAQGKYITFIDSDDIIAPTYLSTLYKIAIRHPEYLAICGYVEFRDSIAPFCCDNKKNEKIVTSNEMICNIFHYHSSACACLFRLDIITKYDIRMEEKASFNEDVFFTCKYLSVCEGAAITQNKLYGYFVNCDGIGAHKLHSDLTLKDVNHRAEGYIALQDAISFTDINMPNKKKYMLVGYTFIAAEVKLTATRAGVKKFDHEKAIEQFLSIKRLVEFFKYSKNIKQMLFVIGIAISPRVIKFLLDDLKLLTLMNKLDNK